MKELFWTVAAVALFGGMFYLAHRMEPHWIAKDDSRFLTTSEAIDRLGTVIGRRREVQVAFLPDGQLVSSRRALVRSSTTIWQVVAKSPDPPKGRAVYLLRPNPPAADGEMLALRLPVGSRMVPLLDALVPEDEVAEAADPRVVNLPRPGPRTRRWGRRSDPG